MYIESVKNRNSPPCILMRESYRENGKVKKRTVANITDWPPSLIAGLKVLLKGGGDNEFDIIRSLPHGHVAAVKATMEQIGLGKLLGTKACPERSLILALIAARILFPSSKLATTRELCAATATTTLGAEFELDDEVCVDAVYAAMDWLGQRQKRIERKLADRHLENGTMVLYDLTSSYMEGSKCPIAKRGHSRDGKVGKLQIEFGLLCDKNGCPVAVEVFAGNTADPNTVGAQIQKIREEFGLQTVVLVGDRGMLTQARIREELAPADGIEWISALRGPAIKKLVEQGHVDMSLFDQMDLASITSPEYPGERLIVCRNPFLADRRRKKREELLAATERKLDEIVTATQREQKRLQGEAEIGIRIGRVMDKYKVSKHFLFEITPTSFTYSRNEQRIAQESILDGLYVIRTSLEDTTKLSDDEAVTAYKSLSHVEDAFRCMKTVDLKVRPIYHYAENRVRTHVFICMLAYYVEWHMRKKLAPFLFEDEFKEEAQLERTSVVAPAKRSKSAKAKDAVRETPEGHPVHSFPTLLRDLGTITRNTIRPRIKGAGTFDKIAIPTESQAAILDRLEAKLL